MIRIPIKQKEGGNYETYYEENSIHSRYQRGSGRCSLGAGRMRAGAQMPDTLKVQNVGAAENVITVTGREEVKVVPDMAQIEYAVYTREDTAAACQEKNANDLNAAIETLKGLGVEETSIQTSSYGLSPIRNWNSDKQEITGYEMTTSLTVSDIPIDNAGTIITKSVAAGVNGINSVSYFSSSYDASYQEALKGAWQWPRQKPGSGGGQQ